MPATQPPPAVVVSVEDSFSELKAGQGPARTFLISTPSEPQTVRARRQSESPREAVHQIEDLCGRIAQASVNSVPERAQVVALLCQAVELSEYPAQYTNSLKTQVKGICNWLLRDLSDPERAPQARNQLWEVAAAHHRADRGQHLQEVLAAKANLMLPKAAQDVVHEFEERLTDIDGAFLLTAMREKYPSRGLADFERVLEDAQTKAHADGDFHSLGPEFVKLLEALIRAHGEGVPMRLLYRVYEMLPPQMQHDDFRRPLLESGRLEELSVPQLIGIALNFALPRDMTVEAVLAVLKRPHSEAAIQFLGEEGDPRLLLDVDLRGSPRPPPRAVFTLLRTAFNVNQLVAADPELKRSVLCNLSRLPLPEARKFASPWLRADVREALKKSTEPNDKVGQSLADSLRALAVCGDAEALDFLKQHITSSDTPMGVREAAVAALSEGRPAAMLPVLGELREGCSGRLRELILGVSARHGDQRAVQALCEQRDFAVSKAEKLDLMTRAAHGLRSPELFLPFLLQCREFPTDRDLAVSFHDAVARALSGFGDNQVQRSTFKDELENYLLSQKFTDDVRYLPLWLYPVVSERSIATIKAAIQSDKDDDPQVQRNLMTDAFFVLFGIPNAGAHQFIIDTLNNPASPLQRECSLEAISVSNEYGASPRSAPDERVVSEQLIKTLADMARDPYLPKDLRVTAVRTLRRLHHASIDQVLADLVSTNEPSRTDRIVSDEALVALAQRESPRTLDLYRQLFQEYVDLPTDPKEVQLDRIISLVRSIPPDQQIIVLRIAPKNIRNKVLPSFGFSRLSPELRAFGCLLYLNSNYNP